ncbi:hypothetical protein C0993_007139, partial [Termitomyces sp. T159_Od127]
MSSSRCSPASLSSYVPPPLPSPPATNPPTPPQKTTAIAQWEPASYTLDDTQLIGQRSSLRPPTSTNPHPSTHSPGLPYFACHLAPHDAHPFPPLPRLRGSCALILDTLDGMPAPLAGALVSSAPHALAVLKLPVADAPLARVFLVFDPHPHDTVAGAGAFLCPTREDAASCLAHRFAPAPGPASSAETPITASFVVPHRPPPAEQDEILLSASMWMLRLEGELHELHERLWRLEAGAVDGAPRTHEWPGEKKKKHRHRQRQQQRGAGETEREGYEYEQAVENSLWQQHGAGAGERENEDLELAQAIQNSLWQQHGAGETEQEEREFAQAIQNS